MTLARLKETVEKLAVLQTEEFEFNGIKIKVNYIERAKHAKTWEIDTHFHPWFEFNYVSKGSVYTIINGKEFFISAGQSYLIPPGVPHSHRTAGTGDDGICIRFSLKSDADSDIIKILSKATAEAFSSGIEKIRLSGSLYRLEAEFAVWLMRIFDLRNTEEPPAVSVHSSFASQAILYLAEYYSEKIAASDIATALNTSYRTLARRFRAETGMTISEKLAEIRISKAKQMLVSTKLSLHAIAVNTGYENEFYFSKIFKSRVGIPPKDYRKKNFVMAEK